jgi:CheY-like chemotaxis protein
MHQVLLNLAVNARDALPLGGRIVIALANVDVDAAYAAQCPDAKTGSHVLLTVTDNGVGMNPEVLQHVFEPFFTTKQRGSGTGLGLATVYGIAKQNGGWVCVRSAPGKGAAFSVFLPGSAAEPESPGGRLPRVEPVRGNETILIAEDNAEVREFACDVLRQRGYRILDAPDAAEAVELVLTHPGPVHLLLTDVVLPAASGKELATRIQELRKETRCVYMSGYAADAIGRRGVLDAGTNFLQKPFTPEALAAKVRAVLDAPPADPGK